MRETLGTIVAAARDRLAQLSPTRRIELEDWTVIDRAGKKWATFDTQGEANQFVDRHAHQHGGFLLAVHMSGTATVGAP